LARSFVLTLVTVIALVAGGVASWAAVSLAQPITTGSIDATARRANAQAIDRFFAAANERLLTGRVELLAAATSADFAFHGGTFPDAVGLATYDRFLGTMHASCPGCV
jgi:hypothetical protein